MKTLVTRLTAALASGAAIRLLARSLIDSSGRMNVDIGSDTATLATTPAPQTSALLTMQNAATANGNGTAVTVDGYNGAQIVEIAETGGGTGTIQIEGSMDNVNWIVNIGYQQTDGQTVPTRSVQSISVAANSRHIYQVLDPYRYLRAVLSSVAGGAAVTARVYCEPV